jgi:histidine triad (HIT) family protein
MHGRAHTARTTLLDLTTGEVSAVMLLAQRVAGAMVELYRPDGILLYQNNGVGSGQEVPHFHLHVIPRRVGSDWGLGPPHLARLELGESPAEVRSCTNNEPKAGDGRRASPKTAMTGFGRS